MSLWIECMVVTYVVLCPCTAHSIEDAHSGKQHVTFQHGVNTLHKYTLKGDR